jgi:hypothetical protein
MLHQPSPRLRFAPSPTRTNTMNHFLVPSPNTRNTCHSTHTPPRKQTFALDRAPTFALVSAKRKNVFIVSSRSIRSRLLRLNASRATCSTRPSPSAATFTTSQTSSDRRAHNVVRTHATQRVRQILSYISRRLRERSFTSSSTSYVTTPSFATVLTHRPSPALVTPSRALCACVPSCTERMTLFDR